MTWQSLKTAALKAYKPALVTENFFSGGFFKFLKLALRALLIFFFGVCLIALIFPNIFSFQISILSYGILFEIFAAWLCTFAFESFYTSLYDADISDVFEPSQLPVTDFALADVLFSSSNQNLIAGFVDSRYGGVFLARAGIDTSAVRTFLKGHRSISGDELKIPDAPYLTLGNYIELLFDQDEAFAKFLFGEGIQKNDASAIIDWLTEREIAFKKDRRWWSRYVLGRIPGLGKDWSYGKTYDLEKYSRSAPVNTVSENQIHPLYGTRELEELESILVRKGGANCFLVSDDKGGSMEIVGRLNYLIETGAVFPELEHKRMVLVDTDFLLASTKTKAAFEIELLRIIDEARAAGNIILVFADFPSFLMSAQSIGSNAAGLLDPYLNSPDLQVIALSSIEHFHQYIESNSDLMQRFERIIIEEIDELNTIRVLENALVSLEADSKVFFTYPALVATADAAERYFPGSVMPDKALDLLSELASQNKAGKAGGKKIIAKDDVFLLVQKKTGVPLGDIGGGERDKLINLEPILHQRIIGQDEAVNAIAAAVRRARSGINNPSRPVASFLFLGPTGVGKTETTKALGEIFFGKASALVRLDMSEYAGPEAIMKLIGSPGGKPGILATTVREHPYGVLLLDEFEKTTSEVMNVFLQVLDEGMFSDSDGKKVNARNLLIIATSNAGAELIWEALKNGGDLAASKNMIIDSIVHAGIFKPELLNRFDGVIVFHPLGHDHLEKIARLQLEKLKKRLAGRGVDLAITDDLVQYVLRFGVDPQFGARPMNRAIQDKVEQVVADKLIRGEARKGSEIVLTAADLK